MEDDQPLETEVDLRNGQNPPLETEIDLRGGARMFFWTARRPAQDACGIARGSSSLVNLFPLKWKTGPNSDEV